MTTREYKLTVGKTSKGIYWARVDSDTHYARATSDDPWTAALNAVHEAQFLFDEPHGEGVDLAAVEALERYAREPDGQRIEAGRIVPTDR